MQLSKIATLDAEAQECYDRCMNAVAACEWCADACAGDPEMATCLRRCRDVAEIATTHARAMARGSPWSAELARICAEACEECAAECAKHDVDHCQVCASVLTDCAESCRAMAGAAT